MTATATIAATPSLDDRIAAVDALAVAQRIGAHRRKCLGGAMAASSIEIVALARRLLKLEGCARATFDMLTALDRLHDDPKAADAGQQRLAIEAQLDRVTVALTALGFAADQDQSQNQNSKPATGADQ